MDLFQSLDPKFLGEEQLTVERLKSLLSNSAKSFRRIAISLFGFYMIKEEPSSQSIFNQAKTLCDAISRLCYKLDIFINAPLASLANILMPKYWDIGRLLFKLMTNVNDIVRDSSLSNNDKFGKLVKIFNDAINDYSKIEMDGVGLTTITP